MYYTVIKHDGHLRTREKCRKHEPQASVFYISRACFKIERLRAKNNKTRFFYVLYSDKTWIFDQSERALGPIYILNIFSQFIVSKIIKW